MWALGNGLGLLCNKKEKTAAFISLFFLVGDALWPATSCSCHYAFPNLTDWNLSSYLPSFLPSTFFFVTSKEKKMNWSTSQRDRYKINMATRSLYPTFTFSIGSNKSVVSKKHFLLSIHILPLSEKRHWWSQLSTGLCVLRYCPANHDVLTGTLVAWGLWGEPTAFWLDWRAAPQQGSFVATVNLANSLILWREVNCHSARWSYCQIPQS